MALNSVRKMRMENSCGECEYVKTDFIRARDTNCEPEISLALLDICGVNVESSRKNRQSRENT